MKELNKKALTIGVIAAILVLLDGIITQIIKIEGSFVWVAFVSWTVFFGATLNERIRAVPGYVIGFLLAIAIINLGNFFNTFIGIKILGVALSSILATGVVNWACMYFEKLEKLYLNSISGIFVGIALTFSGLGVGLSTANMNDALMMILIIMVYSVLGLLSGYMTLKITSK